MPYVKRTIAISVLLAACCGAARAQTAAPARKPNILVMFGDDVGYWNPSIYNRGMMGYRTPNIDRIAHEGAVFTDAYAQQSCTAGRAAFITGQSPVRTGLTKVGLPGAPEGLSAKDPTIAELLKAQGYATGQFGKNHLGDRNEFFPTVHGFDEFFGNFYHLNAEEEPENEDYPKDPAFKQKFGPRGVFKCVATSTETPGEDPRFGKWGKQKCEDTGPLTKQRMETFDGEVMDATLDFIDRQNAAKKPWFVWFNTTRMHIWTHLKPESRDKTGVGIYADGMVEHDAQIGQLLKKLDDLGIADNTIVIWTTDNGAEMMSWPDGGTTPFRGEKNTNWEGGYRVPITVRWPGVIKPGTEINDIISHEDWMPTLLAAAGQPDVKEQLLKGATIGGTSYKVHLDGYNLMPALAGQGEWPRHEFLYWTDDGDLCGLRYNPWKVVFMEQRAHGFDVWQEPMVTLRVPKLFNLRADPFERADHEGMGYSRWRIDRVYALVPAQVFVKNWLESFKEFPPRQKPASACSAGNEGEVVMTKMVTSSILLEGNSIASLAHMLAGGEPVAAQQPEACLWSAEKSLAAAVLASALIEIRDHSGDPKRAALVADELAWVRSEDADHLYAFRRLCELLNLDPQWVRAAVERWHAAGRRRRALLSWRVAA